MSNAAAQQKVPVQTHRGRLAGLNEAQRAAQVTKFKAQATKTDGGAVAAELARLAIAHEPEERFSYMLMERSVEELRVMASDYGIRNVDRLGHDDLVTLICAAAANDKRDCELAAEICNAEQHETLFAALDAGGRIEFSAAQAAVHAHVRPFAPYTFLYSHEGVFTLLVTDVFKENLAALDRKAIERRRKRCRNITDCASGLVEFYGIVEAHKAHELYNSWFEADALGFGEYARIVIREAQSQRYSFMCWSDGKKDYLIHYTLLAATQQDDDVQRKALEQARERIIALHEKTPMRELPREVVCGDAFAWKRALLAVRALRTYLDEHVPAGESDYVFADRTIDELFFALAATPDAKTAGEVLVEAGLEGVVGKDEDLLVLVERLVRELPCWDLNGHSLAEKEGKR